MINKQPKLISLELRVEKITKPKELRKIKIKKIIVDSNASVEC